jgi:acetylornithine deacetylase/succinyl-diaminopimelate desuccinylase-like protein
VESDRIWGNGITNMKNAFVAYIAGLDALQKAGIKLNGDVIIAGTAGEIRWRRRRFQANTTMARYGFALLIHGVAIISR